MIEHDKDCSGCATEREMKRSGGALVRDYLAWCDGCGKPIQGDTEHKIDNRLYCEHCLSKQK